MLRLAGDITEDHDLTQRATGRNLLFRTPKLSGASSIQNDTLVGRAFAGTIVIDTKGFCDGIAERGHTELFGALSRNKINLIVLRIAYNRAPGIGRVSDQNTSGSFGGTYHIIQPVLVAKEHPISALSPGTFGCQISLDFAALGGKFQGDFLTIPTEKSPAAIVPAIGSDTSYLYN